MNGETFFTSDLHFGHANIIKYSYRPYESVEEMNEALVANWNETVAPEDTVIVLGDVVMGKRAETMPLVAQLNGTKFLVPGNHDNCHPMYDSADREAKHNKYIKAREMFEDVGFTIWGTELMVNHEGRDFMISHFPYDGDHGDEIRYPEWRPADHGQWLVHGHVHDLWKVKGRQINVGCDVWDYRPVHIDEVIGLMQ